VERPVLLAQKMSMEFVDTHAHIYSDKFADDRPSVIDQSMKAGVGRIYMPNVDSNSIPSMLEVEERYPATCFAMMGVHPCSIGADFENELRIAEEWLEKRTFCAVGEIGTDLFWDKTFIEQQKEAFEIQCGWAKKYHLPVVIHCRESMDLTIDMVEKLKSESLKGVFHCFNGNSVQAKRIVELGFFLGIGGVSTFKNGGLDAVLPEIGLQHLLLETDSPYLAPAPHRGKRNEPGYIPLIAQRVSELTGASLSEVANVTTANANQLFSYQP